ncbi:ScbR family autoregulator-binding transcription factor [Actinophytocola sp.]|uniref:ScbR family autoregulator-binding transcription factor n=1 Tax=Actinophytocola sp. TaxID=1872138 RepID=UPI003899CB3B
MTKQARSENTRLHLVRSAAELFDRNGFAGATLEDVSRAAGVTKGAFYFHFSSKDELGGAIQAEACALLRAAVYRVGSRRPHVQSLVDLTHELADWLEREPVVRASFRTARENGHRGKPFLDFHTDWLATVETLLVSARRAGELRDEIDVEQAATLVAAVSTGMEMLWWVGIRRGSVRDSLAGMWRLTLPGLVLPDRMSEIDPSGTIRAASSVDIT